MNDLNNTSGVLLIVLSSVLIIFLISAIVAVIKLINVLNSMKRLAATAEKIAKNAESVSEFFTKSAGPLALGKLLSGVTDYIKNHKRGK